MKLDKTMVTEFNDILIVCFTLHMPGNNINLFTPTKKFNVYININVRLKKGVFATVGQQVFRNAKNMWDSLISVPKGIDRKLFKAIKLKKFKLTKLSLKKSLILNCNTVYYGSYTVRIRLLSDPPIGQRSLSIKI